MFTVVLTVRLAGSRQLPCNHERSERTGARDQAGTVPGYCGRPSSSFSQAIFSETQMCSVGAKALRSSKVSSDTPAAVPLRPQENSRVPQVLQNTRSIASEEA